MGSKIIGARIQADKTKIIEAYKNNVSIGKLAGDYDVMVDTMCRRLRNWGIKIKKHDWHKKEKSKKASTQFSSELRARMKENSRINNKRIQYVNFKGTTADQYLVHNIINHPIIG